MFKAMTTTAAILFSLSTLAQGVDVLNSNELDLEGLGRNVSFKMTKNIIIPAGQRGVQFCKKETPFYIDGKIHDCSVSGKVLTGNPSEDARALPKELKGSRSFVNATNNVILNDYRSQKHYQYKLSDDFVMNYEVKCKSADGENSALFDRGFNIELTPGHLANICADSIDSISAKVALVEINSSDSTIGESHNRCAEVSDINRNAGYGYLAEGYELHNVGMSINNGFNLR